MNLDHVIPSEIDFRLAEQWEKASDIDRMRCENKEMYEEALRRVKSWSLVNGVIKSIESCEGRFDWHANSNFERDIIDVSSKSADAEKRKRKPGVYHMVEGIVASSYNIQNGVIRGKSRKRNVTRARFTIYWIMNKEFGWSLTKIGRMMKKDHSSVLHGIRTIEEMHENEETKTRALILRNMCVAGFSEMESC